jgi:hypothetical protein
MTCIIPRKADDPGRRLVPRPGEPPAEVRTRGNSTAKALICDFTARHAGLNRTGGDADRKRVIDVAAQFQG